MKVTLISPYSDITSLGIRIISSLLRREGFSTQIVFLSNRAADQSEESDFIYRYNKFVLEQVINICSDSHIVGISLMTNYFERGIQITKALKENLRMPVIWGGIHPTIRPEESLIYADMVCVGEGEYAILELAEKMERGKSYHNIQNLWFKYNGNIIKNPPRPLIQDLDSLPFPDFDIKTHHILEEDKLLPMDQSLLRNALSRCVTSSHMNLITYQTMATRGCPHSCSFCCNSNLKNMYSGQRYVRRRSIDNIIKELLYVKEHFDFIQAVWFSDDSFFAASNEEIKEFSQIYKRKINLPFFCLGSPSTINEAKIEYLVEAGLRCIQMGIQTGSKRISKEVYNRNVSNEKVINTAQIINKYKSKIMPPLYDFILESNYETEDDILETLKLILKLPRPYHLQLFTLIFYPGTELYVRAKRDGIIYDEQEQIYRKRYRLRQNTYLNLIFSLVRYNNIPKFILRLLINKRVVNILNKKSLDRIYKFVFGLGRRLRRAFT